MNLNSDKIQRHFRIGLFPVLLLYLAGVCNGLVLELLHETSHLLGTQSHHHSFLNHEDTEYANLEALAGHSHETLEALKEMLGIDLTDDQEPEPAIHFEFDEHITQKAASLPIGFLSSKQQISIILPVQFFRAFGGVLTPPPQIVG